MTSPAEWTTNTLALDPDARLRALFPLLEAFWPAWEATWQDRDDLALARAAKDALQRRLEGEPESIDALASQCQQLAVTVGESAQALDGKVGAGGAHLVAGLLAVCLAEAADEPGEVSMEEVLDLEGLLEAFPELGEPISRVIATG